MTRRAARVTTYNGVLQDTSHVRNDTVGKVALSSLTRQGPLPLGLPCLLPLLPLRMHLRLLLVPLLVLPLLLLLLLLLLQLLQRICVYAGLATPS